MQLNKKKIGFLLGPIIFMIVRVFFHPEGLNDSANAVLASTSWVAIWWITETLPISVTALLPIVLFPLSNGLDLKSTTAQYGHKYIFLFLGGFILAIAIEKWNLHKRIALTIIKIVGANITSIILGFMIATAFLSMWISNTATAVMILPVGMAIVSQLKDNSKTIEKENLIFAKALMLAIAYSASIGGMATLIGTPPNLILSGVIQETYNIEISLSQWFLFGFPISLLFLILAWIYLTKFAFKFKQKKFPGGRDEINRQLSNLGEVTFEEKAVFYVFIATAFAWISRSWFLEHFIPKIDDTIIAIISAIILFILPSSEKNTALLNWHDALKLPWGILLLFGGGMALAIGFQSSGLALWIGEQLKTLDTIPLIALVFIVIACINFVTEITSNMATTALMLPILASLANAIDVHPYFLLVGATVAASCAFMLPVATPPNAIVFGSGHLKIKDMVGKGLWLNIVSIIILTLAVYFILPMLWDFPDLS